MARMVDGHKAGILRQYIPEAYENRADDEPIKVWIKSPTLRETRQIFASGIDTRVNADQSVSVDIKDSMRVYEQTIKGFVAKVENYIAAGGDPINNGDQLIEHGEVDLIVEIANHILGVGNMDAEAKKKQGEPST
ncbi:MAG: hypothetical protein CMF70_06995 [Magnetovibrio sp.]|nr:hypothetical protein [Magnetovibrio sp.]|tara:strand:+ start:1899 stop:2303 length:405 start_codon:yes stop_codon:yes gene_type:complete